MDRRTTIKWVMAASAVWPLTERRVAHADPVPSTPPSSMGSQGYGTDPNLQTIYRPGMLWPLTLTEQQRRLAVALSDIIIPADDHSPSASAVGVVDFIDEWVSAPYPNCQQDRPVVLDGFAWLESESGRRFGKPFADASRRAAGSVDDICMRLALRVPAEAARFFALYRNLTAGGFYSTPAGRKDWVILAMWRCRLRWAAACAASEVESAVRLCET